jgi:hypothetical protein
LQKRKPSICQQWLGLLQSTTSRSDETSLS